MKNCTLIPMNSSGNIASNESIPQDLVLRQVQKIVAHPLFVKSEILRRFLLYIVHETVSGRTNTIKEYTIAINVLHKTADFKASNNGIVRIHAGRLRRSLRAYYQVTGDKNEVIISVPNGGYIPVFLPGASADLNDIKEFRIIPVKEVLNKIVLAVIPFITHEKLISRLAFCDSLGQNICTELNKLKNISVISYHAIRQLSPEQTRIKSLANEFEVDYVLTGDVQFAGDLIKVFVQLSESIRQTQIWSDVYQFNLKTSTYFKLSDAIASKIAGIIPINRYQSYF